MKFSVRGRDLASTIAEAQAHRRDPACEKALAACAAYDMRLEWAGEINELHEAEGRLQLIIPLTLLLITFLTYSAVKNWVDTIIVIIDIPVACTGGVLALLFTRPHFSVSAAMGFISIFGIAIQDAILVVTYFQRLRESRATRIEQAAREAAEKRLPPVLDDDARGDARPDPRGAVQRHRRRRRRSRSPSSSSAARSSSRSSRESCSRRCSSWRTSGWRRRQRRDGAGDWRPPGLSTSR